MPAVYIDRTGLEIALVDQSLVIRESQGATPRRLPLAQIDFCLINTRNQVDARILSHLVRQGSTVVLLDGRGGSQSVTLSGTRHGEVQRRMAQYRATIDDVYRLAFARQLMSAKLHNQHRLLRQALATRPDQRYTLVRTLRALTSAHRSLRSCSRLDSMRGIEGAAAASYFRAYATILPQEIGFDGRNRRPPRDPANALLSLGYTLLIAEAESALHRAGLDPLLGLYHDPAHGRPALACDLIEPHRAAIDQLVWRLFAERQLTANHFEISQSACRLKKAGRTLFYAAFEAEAEIRRRALRRTTLRLLRALPGAPQDTRAGLIAEQGVDPFAGTSQ